MIYRGLIVALVMAGTWTTSSTTVAGSSPRLTIQQTGTSGLVTRWRVQSTWASGKRTSVATVSLQLVANGTSKRSLHYYYSPGKNAFSSTPIYIVPGRQGAILHTRCCSAHFTYSSANGTLLPAQMKGQGVSVLVQGGTICVRRFTTVWTFLQTYRTAADAIQPAVRVKRRLPGTLPVGC